MKSNARRNWVSIFIKFILSTGFVLILLFAALHSHYVQDRITKFFISSLVSNSEGKVSVRNASFNIYRGVEMNGLLVIDEKSDTLLTINKLGVSPKSTLLSFIRGKMDLNDINIEGSSIFLRRKSNEDYYNWQNFISGFSKEKDNSKPSQGLDIELNQLQLYDLSFSLIDEKTGLKIEAYLDGLEIEIENFMTGDSAVINLKRWVLTNPQLDIYQSYVSQPVDALGAKNEASPGVLPRVYIANLDMINGFAAITTEDEDAIRSNEYSDLDLSIRNLIFDSVDDWSMVLEDLSSKTPFAEAQHLEIKKMARKGESFIGEGAVLRTRNSLVRFDVKGDKLRDWFNATDVEAEINLKPSILRLAELFPFIPALKKEFAGEVIATRPIQIQGKYWIEKSRLRGKDIAVWVNGRHYFSGDAVLNNRRDIRNSSMNIQVNELRSDVKDFANLYSRAKFNEELLRFGKIAFKGNFNGKLKDFKASGDLLSDLGRVRMNVEVQQDIKGSLSDSINYAGLLELDSFNLAAFLQNPDFGMIDANLNIRNGTGKDISNSDAKLEANIDRFEYKGFRYRDARYEGRLSRKIIDGTFIIRDADLDFQFDGIVDLSSSVPIYDFELNAGDIDFCKLNLTEFPCHLSFLSDVNFQGKNFKTAHGEGKLSRIVLRHDTSELVIDNILITSREIAKGMAFLVQSDYLDAEIEGEFNLIKMYQAIYRQLLTNHSDQNKVINLADDMGDIPDQDFTYDIRLKDASPLFEFLGIGLDLEGETSIKGEYKKEEGLVEVNVLSPFLVYKDVKAKSLSLSLDSRENVGKMRMQIGDIGRDQLNLYDLKIETDIDKDLLTWNTSFYQNESNKISIFAESRAQSNGYFTEILEHDLVIDSAIWKILPNPGFGIYRDRVDISNLVATDGSRSIGLKDIDQKGLEVSMNDFNFEYINPLINYDKLYFTGSADSKVRIENIFDKRSVQGYLEVPEFAINGDDYGSLLLRASQGSENIIDLDLSITKDSQNLYTRGYVDTKKEYINVDLTFEDYPMNFFEYIITSGISETEGTTDIDAKIYGSLDDMKLSGLAIVKDAGVKIDYLGTFYRMYDQKIKIDEKFIDLNGIQLIDARENIAVMTGGLRHNFLGDFRTDLSISAPEFIALSTTNLDNPLYYGLGNGNIEVTFDGPFDAVNMKVNTTTGPLTQLFIPINSTQYGYDESFIKFDYQDLEKDSARIDDLVSRLQESGVDFEMNLTFTPDAEVSVIYDESTSNILYGRGRGNLRILVKRDGEFSVYGNYDIEEGEYRYTAYGFIAKPFIINRGGKISWTGDPINANLEVTADYAGLRAPLNVFLQEYIASSTLQPREFSQRREVDLTLLLSGTLYNPAIDFDIDFPNLTGELKTLADSKVRALSSTENGINNQVVGLLVFRNFLPDNNPFASIEGSTLGQSGNNTITEFLTSQLSLLFSDYLSEKLAGNGFIEGIDFEIAVAQNTSVLESGGQEFIQGLVDFVPDEVQLNLRNRFKNDNFVLSIGGNYVRQSEFETASDYLTGDFALDWFISDDKRLKLRFYGNYDYDEAFAERKQKYGFGINYRREFGSITKFQNVLDGLIEDINKAGSPPTTNLKDQQ